MILFRLENILSWWPNWAPASHLHHQEQSCKLSKAWNALFSETVRVALCSYRQSCKAWWLQPKNISRKTTVRLDSAISPWYSVDFRGKLDIVSNDELNLASQLFKMASTWELLDRARLLPTIDDRCLRQYCKILWVMTSSQMAGLSIVLDWRIWLQLACTQCDVSSGKMQQAYLPWDLAAIRGFTWKSLWSSQSWHPDLALPASKSQESSSQSASIQLTSRSLHKSCWQDHRKQDWCFEDAGHQHQCLPFL